MPAPVILATLAVTVQTAWRALQAPRRPCLGTLRVLRTRAQAISSARRGRLTNTAAVCWAYPSCAVSVAASTTPTACQCQACTYEDTQVLNPSYAQRSYSSMWADRDFFSLLGDLHSSLSWAALTNTPGGEWMEIDAGTYCRSHHTGTRWLMVNSMGQRIQIGTSTRQYRGI